MQGSPFMESRIITAWSIGNGKRTVLSDGAMKQYPLLGMGRTGGRYADRSENWDENVGYETDLPVRSKKEKGINNADHS